MDQKIELVCLRHDLWYPQKWECRIGKNIHGQWTVVENKLHCSSCGHIGMRYKKTMGGWKEIIYDLIIISSGVMENYNKKMDKINKTTGW